MNGLSRFGILALAACMAASPALHSQDKPDDKAADKDKKPEGPAPKEESSVTDHTIKLAGQSIPYKAIAQTMLLKDDKGESTAVVYSTAYIRSDVKDPSTRPIAFLYNGGPGSSSVWLHMGSFGPRRVITVNAAITPPAPYKVEDNSYSLLDKCDLVFVDPVGTGWSRAAKPDGAGAFWGVRRDSESIAKVIALYVAKNGRASSPKYILGESYGGFRAAKVASDLRSDQGIVVTGILMVSPMVESGLHSGSDRLALGAALQLPSLVATELERTGSFSQEALAQAEHFALTDYLTTLAGPPLSGDLAKAFYSRVAQMTGLPEDVVARSRGFIRGAYVKNLRLGEHKIVSHYDATFAIDDPHPESPEMRGPDPLLDGVVRAYGGAFVAYARDELGFKTDLTYNLLSSEISDKWDWHDGSGHAPPSATDELRELLALTPSFRLMIAHGYSDMATPYAVSRYVLDHLPPSVDEERSELRLYRRGHMFYTDPQSRKGFTADARTLYAQP